jgi:Ni/Co efflux regulator RcnB
MKKLLISAAATALLFGTALASPPSDEQPSRHKQAMQNTSASDRPDRAMNRMDASTDTKVNTDRVRNRMNVDRNLTVNRKVDVNRDETVNRNINVNRNVTINRDVNVNRNVTVNRDTAFNHNVTVGRQFNNRYRNFNIAVFQRNVRASRHFHIGFYRAPTGYSYRRWVYGQRLPSTYFGRDYWLTDYLAFGLMAPPPGFVWVRFGPDALLIDEFTGEIVQVQYGIFI